MILENSSEPQSSSTEMARQCRYCQESEPQCDLIQPCNCKGTLAFTHRSCLRKWVKTRLMHACSGGSSLNSTSFSTNIANSYKCELCKFAFKDATLPHRIIAEVFVNQGRIMADTSADPSSTRAIPSQSIISEKFCWIAALVLSAFLVVFTILQYAIQGGEPNHGLLVTVTWFMLGLIWFAAFIRRMQALYWNSTTNTHQNDRSGSSSYVHYFIV